MLPRAPCSGASQDPKSRFGVHECDASPRRRYDPVATHLFYSGPSMPLNPRSLRIDFLCLDVPVSLLSKLCAFAGRATLGILLGRLCLFPRLRQRCVIVTQLGPGPCGWSCGRSVAASRANELVAMNDKRKDEMFDGVPSHYVAVTAFPFNVYVNYKQLLHSDGQPLTVAEAKMRLAVRRMASVVPCWRECAWGSGCCRCAVPSSESALGWMACLV